MIRTYLLCLLPLAACNTAGERAHTGECPAGEDCSAATPNGLHFIGSGLADDVFGILAGPQATAIGGTQGIALKYDRGDGNLRPLDLLYDADDDGGLGVTVDRIEGAVVTVRGAGSRSNYLRILGQADGLLFDRYELTGAALKRIELVGTGGEIVPPGTGLVWATGDQTIGIALYGDVQHSGGPVSERLVDTSLIATLAGATRTRWDEVQLAHATAGHHALAVTAGDKPAADLDVEVVDGASAIAFQGTEPATIASGSSSLLCFSALSSNRYIYGLSWTFQVDGGAPITQGAGMLASNCVDVSVPASRTTGTVMIAASAGGRSMTLAATIGAAAHARRSPALRTVPTTGERAAR